ncbi:hypothetical protein [Candidatus Ruminimicrobiellum ovillum]|uniref:hypothetical protein n=1 Tax=Candidatus Ruminimicrobiellum ovillum TaxID=1947927 RepID=UPI0035599555
MTKYTKTKYYQHKRNTIGEVVTDLDDIAQCYRTIFETVKGTAPLAPELGTNIIEMVGENLEEAEKLIKTILKSDFETQEPRGEIIDISLYKNNINQIVTVITFKAKYSNSNKTLTEEFVI